MGLFSSSKKTYVSSTVYNMAGDELNRMNYLKTTVIGGVLSPKSKKNFLGETIVNAHLNGPGISQRSFFRWARDNYSLGMPTARLDTFYNLNTADVAAGINTPQGKVPLVQYAYVDGADFSLWAEQFIRINHPDRIDTAWTSDISSNNVIMIQYEDNSTESFSVTNYDKDANYLIAYYYFITLNQSEPVQTGSLVQGNIDTSSWTYNTSTITSSPNVALKETTKVVKTYSNGTPSTTTTDVVNRNEVFNRKTDLFNKVTYQGISDETAGTVNSNDILNLYIDYIIENVVTNSSSNEPNPNGGTVTTTTTVTREVLTNKFSHRIDTQKVISNGVENTTPRMLIYKMGGSNSAFNNLENKNQNSLSEFFPFLPVRIDNKPFSNYHFPNEFPIVSKTYKKATNKSSFIDLLDKIEENENIDDIDYCYMVYGVSANVIDNSGRKYIFDFFKKLKSIQNYSYTEYASWRNSAQQAMNNQEIYNTWYRAQLDRDNPLYNTPSPIKPVSVLPPANVIRISSNNELLKSFDIRISWVTIQEKLIAGKGKPTAKTGDVWFNVLPDDTFNNQISLGIVNRDLDTPTVEFPFYNDNISKVEIYYQEKDDYRVLNIIGMKHNNYVYDGKSVDINLKDAINSVDESGFIVPLHYPTIKEMSLIDSTQLTTANTFLVFNSYQVVKKKWYQTGLFKIIIIIAVAIAVVVFAPAGAATGGILGSNAALGASLGLTGTAALIAGAVANALAAMILVQIVETGATALFGEKIGMLVAAVVGFMAANGGMFFDGGSLAINWGSMMKADTLLKMTQTLSGVTQKWIAADIQELQTDMLELNEKYDKDMDKIKKLSLEMFGIEGGVINPMMLTDFDEVNTFTPESLDLFLTRTLLTGSEISELSINMIENFVESTLELPKAGFE